METTASANKTMALVVAITVALLASAAALVYTTGVNASTTEVGDGAAAVRVTDAVVAAARPAVVTPPATQAAPVVVPVEVTEQAGANDVAADEAGDDGTPEDDTTDNDSAGEAGDGDTNNATTDDGAADGNTNNGAVDDGAADEGNTDGPADDGTTNDTTTDGTTDDGTADADDAPQTPHAPENERAPSGDQRCLLGYEWDGEACVAVPEECPEGSIATEFGCAIVDCIGGYIYNGTECVPYEPTCPEGTTDYGEGVCVPDAADCPPGTWPVGEGCAFVDCIHGYVYDGTECAPICPELTVWLLSECVPITITCLPGHDLVGEECVPRPCPQGQVRVGGTCVEFGRTDIPELVDPDIGAVLVNPELFELEVPTFSYNGNFVGLGN